MRYFKKKTYEDQPILWANWLIQNKDSISAWVLAKDKKGGQLWEELGKTFGKEVNQPIPSASSIKESLTTSLFEEQNGLCCYCGDIIKRTFNDDIWHYQYCSIEHFKPKHLFKELTFEYDNLMLCCKASRLSFYEVAKTPRENPIRNVADVAQLCQLDEERILSYQKNKQLKNSEIKPGHKIYFPNPPHCDDSKSEHDRKKKQIEIINPAKDKDLIERLIFKSSGLIDYLKTNPNDDELINNTVNKVLELNCEILVEKRKLVWKQAQIILNDLIISSAEEDLINKVQLLILNKSKPNDEGLLDSFFFVEIAFYKLSFNAKTE